MRILNDNYSGGEPIMNTKLNNRLAVLIFILTGLMLAPNTFADDVDDVMAVIYQYGDLEMIWRLRQR